MPVGGNQIKEYCKCCTERGGASQTGWRGIIPILKGCSQISHSPAFLTVLLIKEVHLLACVLVSFSFWLLHVPHFPIFMTHEKESISCQLVMVNLHPRVGRIVWNTGLFLPCILQSVVPAAWGHRVGSDLYCSLSSGCCVAGQFSAELVGWLWLLRQVIFSCARKRWKAAAQSSVGQRDREEKFLVKKDGLPYDSCCVELSTSLYPQPHKSFLHAEKLGANEPGKRKDMMTSSFFRPVL